MRLIRQFLVRLATQPMVTPSASAALQSQWDATLTQEYTSGGAATTEQAAMVTASGPAESPPPPHVFCIGELVG